MSHREHHYYVAEGVGGGNGVIYVSGVTGKWYISGCVGREMGIKSPAEVPKIP